VRTSFAAIAVLALTMASPEALARSVDEELPADALLPEEPHLFQWDLLEDMAQQQPTTPPPLPVPGQTTTPPAAPPAQQPAPPPLAQPAPDTPPAAEEGVTPDAPATDEEAQPEDEFSIGDIPVVETVELTLDKAKKGLDVYILVREKYKDADLENFENWQDFVDKSPQGKAFETDLKAAGFANATEWNTVVTTLSFTYDNSIKDDTAEIKQQIEELKADTEMAQDMRDRMITALNAMIPSDNNKKVLADLKVDPVYAEKVKQLETESETE
jgi:hypothetical protein